MVEVKVYKTWSSPFSLRVELALKMKGVEYETISEDLKSKSDDLLRYNPVNQRIPVLLHAGKPVCESLIILEYIDETWTQNPLLPQDPYDKAMARFWAKFSDDKLGKSIRESYFAKGKEQEEGVVQAQEHLKLIEEQLKDKKFFGGDNVGYLDLVLGWMAYMPVVFAEITGLKLIDDEKFPLLSAWIHNFRNDPTVRDHLPPHDKLIAMFQPVFAAIPPELLNYK